MTDQEFLFEITESYLKATISQITDGLDGDFDSSTPFGELGIDSFYVLKAIKRLEEDFGTLPKTLLFENFNVNDLANYFVANHESTLRNRFAQDLQRDAASGEPHAVNKAGPESAGIEETTSAPERHAMRAATAPEKNAPVVILEKNAYQRPELAEVIGPIFDRYKDEGSVSRGTRNIAPNLFIGAERQGYFNFARSRDLVLVYAYTGPRPYFPTIAQEVYRYCKDNDYQLNLLATEPLGTIGDIPFSSTPFGVLQRVSKLETFSLEGGSMRRLRYQVSKFKKSGVCRTEEFCCGSDPAVSAAIADVIDQWCNARTMVNPLIHIVKDEILQGTLNPEHRIFLSYLDSVLQNVILISPMSAQQNGYLMDLEFYTRDMPLGGLEYAIVNIIETLVAEGIGMLSLGGTYGCKLENSADADPQIDNILDELRQQGIFNDDGNLQFKNKFRPETRSIYLCREVGSGSPDNVIDIIMMIADPEKMQSLNEDPPRLQVVPDSLVPDADGAAVPAEADAREAGTIEHSGSKYATILADHGYNPLNIPAAQVDVDLKTDSWAQLEMPAITKQMRHLHTQLQQSVSINDLLHDIFPFKYFVLTPSGRTAEHIFYKSWPGKGVVPQNLLFPTAIFHQIDNGFTPKELPLPGLFGDDAETPNQGNLDLGALRRLLAEWRDSIAMVCIEVSDNAAAGAPVAIEHLKSVKSLLTEHAVPLVIDATRVVENAQFVIEQESGYADRGIWEVVREMLSFAEVVIASLAKDFCVDRGGLIATSDESLFRRLQALTQEEGSGLDVIDKKLIALGLRNTEQIKTRVLRRKENVRFVGDRLRKAGLPVVGIPGGHCVLLDVKKIPEFSEFEEPVPSFLAWLFLNTGIRAGAHSVGMQKGCASQGLVRLAIPVGLDRGVVETAVERLIELFANPSNIPEITRQGDRSDGFNDIHAKFDLKVLHRIPVAEAVDAVEPGSQVNAAQREPDRREPSLPDVKGDTDATPERPVARQARPKMRQIAIVGMAGRYPGAADLNAFWENLKQGTDSVDLIPDSRLASRGNSSASVAYRGGFLEDVDRFDSVFFNISPREAEILDPQERLFLEVAWEAIEDAGYYPEALSRDGAPGDVGVFVGAVWAMYQMLGVEQGGVGDGVQPNSFLWSIANRVSYWMNLSGPSLTVDTACSSSLTAIYLACQAIENGDCSSAIVGGVNLDLHPQKYAINLAGGALAKDGVCRSFGSGANGYVAGEGVGAVFLKPLEQAVADRDQIHGVIKAVAANHGGKTSGYTVPNPKAQADLITAALKKADVDARTIGYIEAHGTGTELGDPIEITGLTNAFAGYGVQHRACAIGSVKTNIGHLEAAAGIVGLTKVLLQMRHAQLVPSLHSAELNAFIDFEHSPFYVEQELREWKAREVDGVLQPLRAAVSSFGAGGANAHVIVEQYASPRDPAQPRPTDRVAYVFPISARNEAQLREFAIRLKTHIERDLTRPLGDQQQLGDIAYTLQVGKKSFDHRAAILARTKQELIERLTGFIENGAERDALVGHVRNADSVTRLLNRKEKEAFTRLLSEQRSPKKLAQLWIDGLLSDCQGMAASEVRRKVSLPTYPFADKRHWAVGVPKAPTNPLPMPLGIHPLIDSNESTFEYQRFRKRFHLRDFFIHDHVVSGIPTLPGTAYLELVRKAGEIAAGRRVRQIRNIVWVTPLAIEDAGAIETLIDLRPKGSTVQFEVYRAGDYGAKVLYSQGALSYSSNQDATVGDEYIDLNALKEKCVRVMDGPRAYDLFKSAGLEYGPGFQVLRDVFTSDTKVLGVLRIPDVCVSTFHEYLLHPSLMDAAMQAGVVAQLGNVDGEMIVPYSIAEVEILHPLVPECFSVIARSERGKDDKVARDNVLIVDASGKILVKIHDAYGVPIGHVHESAQREPGTGLHEQMPAYAKLYYVHEWDSAPLPEPPALDEPGPLLLFDRDEKLRNLYVSRLQQRGAGAESVVLVRPGEAFRECGKRIYEIDPAKPEDYIRLIETLQQDQWVFGDVCFVWSTGAQCEGTGAGIGGVLDDALRVGVYAFLYLCQAIIANKLSHGTRLVYLYSGELGSDQTHNEAINGFVKTLRLENAKLSCKVVELRQAPTDTRSTLDRLLAELAIDSSDDDTTVRYDGATRYVRRLRELSLRGGKQLARGTGFKQRGVYLITGGAGGLGLVFARFLAQQCRARLVLTGRSELSEARRIELDTLAELGSEYLYLSADVARYDDVERVVEATKARFGQINGVIHCAGVIRDSLLRNKTAHEMAAVFAPKIHGTRFLDELTRDEALDFFVMFSSLAAVAGNAGQCDYAYANHYMDAFAAERDRRVARGERSGKCLSLNWSLWAEGGMQLDEQTEQFFIRNLGINPLTADVGVEAFVNGLSAQSPQLAFLHAKQDKIERAWGLNLPAIANADEGPQPDIAATLGADVTRDSVPTGTAPAEGDLRRLVQQRLTDIVIDFLKLDESDVDLDTILLDLGFDSIGLASFANAVNDVYQTELTPVLFFEYPNIREIAKHIAQAYHDQVRRVHALNAAAQDTATDRAPPAQVTLAAAASPDQTLVNNKGWTPSGVTQERDVAPGAGFELERRFEQRPIAIVGMSGIMPQSNDLDAFWDNLENARNLVTEIPRDRWNWKDFDGNPIKEKNRSNSRWGGFMSEIDKFDPLFFGITPKEAEMMDPQQRILLETVCHAIEDAGQSISSVAGTKTGVFVGVSAKDYVDEMAESDLTVDGYSASGTSHSILANRISFLLDLSGPSAPLDTACSSSLVALHRAIESIHTGSSDMAIVGGVQVMLTPAAHIALSSAGMLSTDGKCKTFDQNADGYVRGEGVGAVFLKPLDMAEADGNPIHAVIKSTAENHGGRVTMLTAPNPAAQADLLLEAYEKAGIDPTTVGYIECHGTGTSLGDPIEIQALKTAFSELYRRHEKAPAAKPHCGLSAVKTNIGHLEPAAGMAGLLKALLAIKHSKIPALIHFENLNPYIELASSPFYIVDKTTPWEVPRDSAGNPLPRRAGVSSFGWGGANAHVVLEEYIPPVRSWTPAPQGPVLVPLSARTEDRLEAYVQAMLRHLETHDLDLVDLAYTLQVGRDPMACRLGIAVGSKAQLIERFGQFLAGDTRVDGLYFGKVRQNADEVSLNDRAAQLVSNNEHDRLLQDWVNGAQLDWDRLYGATRPRRLNLPGYPFARERYWIDTSHKARSRISDAAAAIHPLLHRNSSDMNGVRFESTFGGKEFFLSGHRLQLNDDAGTQRVVPSTAYLEMVRVAALQARPGMGGAAAVELTDVSWGERLVPGPSTRVCASLVEQSDGRLRFTVYSHANGAGQVVHCQGAIRHFNAPEPATLSHRQLQALIGEETLGAEALGRVFDAKGAVYGESFRAITSIYQNAEQQLLSLILPAAVSATRVDYVLHPSITESIVQGASILIGGPHMDSDPVSPPVGLASLQIFSPCVERMFAWIRYARGAKPTDQQHVLDVDLIDTDGAVCARFRSLSFASAQAARLAQDRQQDFARLIATLLETPGPEHDANVEGSLEPDSMGAAFEQALDRIFQ
jgi:polyketide synthase PksN